MNIQLIPREVRDMDAVLAFIMLVGVAVAACVVIYLLGHHHHHKRKAKKKADHDAHARKHGRPHDHTSVDEG